MFFGKVFWFWFFLFFGFGFLVLVSFVLQSSGDCYLGLDFGLFRGAFGDESFILSQW